MRRTFDRRAWFIDHLLVGQLDLANLISWMVEEGIAGFVAVSTARL